jgi:hypothetical protein
VGTLIRKHSLFPLHPLSIVTTILSSPHIGVASTNQHKRALVKRGFGAGAKVKESDRENLSIGTMLKVFRKA